MRGSGTAADPYIIEDVADLQNMQNDLSAIYVLGNDIDASVTSTWHAGAGFVPVGDAMNLFEGSLDGAGHTIRNLYINRPATDDVGLFGPADTTAVIKNIIFSGGAVVGRDNVGLLAGVNYSSTDIDNVSAVNCAVSGRVDTGGLIGRHLAATSLINCSFTGTVTGVADSYDQGSLCGYLLSGASLTDSWARATVSGGLSAVWGVVGGLVGQGNDNNTATRCFFGGTVNGSNDYVAGLFGAAGDNLTLTHCYVEPGSVITGSGDYVAGLVAGNGINGTFTDSYNFAQVNGVNYVGGIGGYLSLDFVRCFNAGKITGSGDDVGGLAGYKDNDTTDCYNSGEVSGADFVAGLYGEQTGVITRSYSCGKVTGTGANVGGLVANSTGSSSASFWDTEVSGQSTSAEGTGMTTVQMKAPYQYLLDGWDLEAIWGLTPNCNQGYPCLREIQGGCIFLNSLLVNNRIFNIDVRAAR